MTVWWWLASERNLADIPLGTEYGALAVPWVAEAIRRSVGTEYGALAVPWVAEAIRRSADKAAARAAIQQIGELHAARTVLVAMWARLHSGECIHDLLDELARGVNFRKANGVEFVHVGEYGEVLAGNLRLHLHENYGKKGV